MTPLKIIIIVAAIVLKLALFFFAETHYPQSKFLLDSSSYLSTGEVLLSRGAFATQDINGGLHSEFRRTPGYPAFLGILNNFMRIPINGVIFIQVLLTLGIALLVYKTAFEIDPPTSFLSAAIILYSPVISIFSLMILTETLFLFFMSIFMFTFVKYLKGGEVRFILAASMMLVLAAYVRPGAYFLGLAVTFFILYSNVMKDIKKTMSHAIIFLAVVYGLLGLWQMRNFIVFKDPIFCIIFKEESGLGKDFLVNCDVVGHGVLTLMTSPGSFKYFHCAFLTTLGKVLGYPWMFFWMTGFLYGVARVGRNIKYQFLLFVILCFIYGSVTGAIDSLGERFRMPMEPFIAILSAYGWHQLIVYFKTRKAGV